MIRKPVTYMIIFIVIVMCSLCTIAIAEQDGLYTYELNEDMTITITGYNWEDNHGDIYIPEMLGNRMVSAIGEKAFATHGNEPVSITLPDGIKSIGELAFQGVAIKYFNIPLNTSVIGDGAFCQCSVMQFRVAEGHQVFATIDNALYNKQEKKLIAWPENKEISPIPNGIKAIGGYVFYERIIGEDSLQPSDLIPDSLTSIGKYAFYNAHFNGYLKNVQEIGDYAFSKDKRVRRECTLWDSSLSLSVIGAHAFENSRLNLLAIETLSSCPCEIGDYAFYNSYCRLLHDPKSRLSLINVTSIGNYAFASDDESICYLALSSGDFNNLVFVGEGAFLNNRVEGTVYLSTVKTIPASSFKTTGQYGYLESVVLDGIVTEIADEAFKGQSRITDIVLNDGLLSIGSEAFMGCIGLTEISIPSSVNYIGENVFADCSDKLVITVEAGSYGEVWTRTCGYSYKINGEADDTSWLDD